MLDIHQNSSGVVSGDVTQDASAGSAQVSISSGAVINGSVYGGQAVNYAPHVSFSLGDAESSGNSVGISSSTIGGQVFGGYAYSENNGASGDATASGNTLNIVDSTLKDLAIGGYTERMRGSVNSMAENNAILVSGSGTRSLYGGYVGMTLSNDASAVTSVRGNRVIVENGSDVSGSFLMGAYVNFSEYSQNTVTSSENEVSVSDSTTHVSIYGSHVRGLFEYHADGSLASMSTNNRVTIRNSDVYVPDEGGIFGAYAYDSADTNHNDGIYLALSGNSVTVEESSVTAAEGERGGIYGGSGDATATHYASDATVTANSVVLTSSTLEGMDVAGGRALSSAYEWAGGNGTGGDADASYNTVLLSGSTVTGGSIYGGFALAQGGENNGRIKPGVGGDATASHNTVVIDGGSVSGGIFGGYAIAESLSGTGDGYLPTGDAVLTADDNRIILRGDADLSLAALYGSNLANALTSGNTLEIDGWSGTVQSVDNFNALEFKNIAWRNGGSVLEIADADKSLQDTEIRLVSLQGGSVLAAGEAMYIVRSDEPLGTQEELVSVDAAFTSGVAVEGEGDVLVDENGNVRFEITGTHSSGQVNILARHQALAAAFLNNGSEMVGDALQHLDRTPLGLDTFAIVQGSALSYDVADDLKIKGWNGIYGIGNTVEKASFALFFENGDASYKAWNNTLTGHVRSDGDLQYYGGGLALRCRPLEDVHVDLALRAGEVSNDIDGILSDAGGRLYGYEMTTPYYSLHFGLGKDFALTRALSAGLYATYDFTRTEDEDFTIDGDRFEFGDMTCQVMRVGSRLNYAPSDMLTVSLGGAWEYEFEGDSDVIAQGHRLETQTLRGGSGLAELVLTCTPDESWTISTHLRAYGGEKEGISGNFHVSCRF